MTDSPRFKHVLKITRHKFISRIGEVDVWSSTLTPGWFLARWGDAALDRVGFSAGDFMQLEFCNLSEDTKLALKAFARLRGTMENNDD